MTILEPTICFSVIEHWERELYAMVGHVTSDPVFGQLINETMLPGSNYIAKYKDKAEVNFFRFLRLG